MFELSDHQGKVIIVAFVYTACPDICLIISSNLDYVDENLGDKSDDVVIISVTIDPARIQFHLSSGLRTEGTMMPPCSQIHSSANISIMECHN